MPVDRPSPPSLQEIIRYRTQAEFVGREQYLADFRANLLLPLDDERRRFIYNIYGPAGVGKTSLLRRFEAIARQAGLVTAWSDDSAADLLTVMEQLATHFEAQGRPLAALSERLRAHHSWSPAVPLTRDQDGEFAPFTRQLLVKPARWGSIHSLAGPVTAIDRIVPPLALPATEMADEAAEPVRALTPLFVDSLRLIARKGPLALFFDGYEQTRAFLDSWLRAILDGQFGDLPASLLIGIAGQERLDLGQWVDFEPIIARVSLDGFSDDEVRRYLALRGIVDEREVATVLQLSGRIPVLVATLALGGTRRDGCTARPASLASYFLGAVDDPSSRGILVDAALPRQLDENVVSHLVGQADRESLMHWLRDLPFVEQRGGRIGYRKAVREDLLRYLRQEAPDRWVRLQASLAAYYEQLMDRLSLSDADRRWNPTWQAYAIEALYHRLCQAPRDALVTALSGFVAAFSLQLGFARSWARAIEQAGADVSDVAVHEWGRRLARAVDTFQQRRYDVVAETFAELLESNFLDEGWRREALIWRSRLLFASGSLDQAVGSYQELIALAPEVPEHWVEKGVTLLRLGRYQAALDDFDRALQIAPCLTWALANRGETLRLLERYDDALSDFSAVLAEQPDNVSVLGSRGQVYAALGKYEDAVADLSVALELSPGEAWLLVERGNAWRGLRKFDAALQDLTRALELDPGNVWARAIRGDVFWQLRQVDEAREDFQLALAERTERSVAAVLQRSGYPGRDGISEILGKGAR